MVELGHSPEFSPRNADWGERYFHVRDPDGHVLSFAQHLPPATQDDEGAKPPNMSWLSAHLLIVFGWVLAVPAALHMFVAASNPTERLGVVDSDVHASVDRCSALPDVWWTQNAEVDGSRRPIWTSMLGLILRRPRMRSIPFSPRSEYQPPHERTDGNCIRMEWSH
ncbi:MAG: hypothetical protein KatS3mg105_5054 [Gemmatales bacterium]|nr:MAG: hypothetical protein KatS3mg105_5054 [Gemmatales bacterium]